MQAASEITKAQAAPQTFKVATPTRHIDSLRDGPDNPRDKIDPDDPEILKLADSIERHGVIEPLVIKPNGELVAGHRRRVASRVAAKRTGRADLLIVPVVIREVEPGAELELMLAENMQRQSLSPLEEARGMWLLMDRKKLTLGDMARRVSVPVVQASSRLAILKLELPVQKLYGLNQLPLQAAPFLAHVANAEKQVSWAGMLARRVITVDKLKAMVRALPKRGTVDGRTIPMSGGQNSLHTTADIPAPTSNHKPKSILKYGKAGHTIEEGAPRQTTRIAAEQILNKNLSGRISMTAFRAVVDSVCCACGMKAHQEVCINCPLPRLIMGVVGRIEN